MGVFSTNYQVIYADPPWCYKDNCNAGKRGASHKYQTMTLSELRSEDYFIRALTEYSKHCTLFMWATWPLINDAMELIKAWEFEYKTIGFIWIKLNKNKPTPFMGMGNWTRSNSEPCLIATKGIELFARQRFEGWDAWGIEA